MRRPSQFNHAGAVFLLAAGPVLATAACYAPTEIVLAVSTDLSCDVVSTKEAVILVGGADAELATASPIATIRACKGSPSTQAPLADLGTLVFVPSENREAQVVIKVALGVDRPTSECLSGDAKGCIVARRAARFREHRTQRLPIRLDRACLGVSCTESETCERGRCFSLDTCGEQGCASPSSGDGGVDGGVDSGEAPLVCSPGRASCDGDPANGCEVDLTDAAHCGACDRNCGGGACVEGVCQATVLASGLDHPSSITLTEKDVLVALDLAHPAGKIVRCPLTGCTAPTQVVGALWHPMAIRTMGSDILWSDQQKGVFRCALPVCTTPVVLCTEGALDFVVGGSDVVLSSIFNEFIGRCSAASTQAALFSQPSGSPRYLATDLVSVFYAQSPYSLGGSGGIETCPFPAGCSAGFRPPPPLLIATIPGKYNEATSLKLDGSFVYWTESVTGDVVRASKTLRDGSTVLAKGLGARRLVIDDTHVFFLAADASGGSVHRMKKDGSEHVVLAKDPLTPVDLALGPNETVKRVFWTSAAANGLGDVRAIAR